MNKIGKETAGREKSIVIREVYTYCEGIVCNKESQRESDEEKVAGLESSVT